MASMMQPEGISPTTLTMETLFISNDVAITMSFLLLPPSSKPTPPSLVHPSKLQSIRNPRTPSFLPLMPPPPSIRNPISLVHHTSVPLRVSIRYLLSNLFPNPSPLPQSLSFHIATEIFHRAHMESHNS